MFFFFRTKNIYLHISNFQTFAVLQDPEAESAVHLKFYTKISAILEETTEINSALTVIKSTHEKFKEFAKL